MTLIKKFLTIASFFGYPQGDLFDPGHKPNWIIIVEVP